MNEETKKKLCKISKIVGFAITFGFAVFGALCAAMLIGNGSKKDDIKTLDSSLVLNEVRSERNSKPRKAPDFSNSPNLLEDVPHVDKVRMNSQGFVYDTPFKCYYMTLGAGYYYLTNVGSWASGLGFDCSLVDFYNGLLDAVDTETTLTSFPSSWNSKLLVNGDSSVYFYWKGGTFGLSIWGTNLASLYLVDTLDLPASSNVYLGENWNPLKAFGDTLSEKGGYLLTDESWTANSSTFKNLTISGLLFKYEGVVYDRIYLIARPLNSSAYPYVDSSGAIVERAITQNSGPNEIYVLDYVGFGQSWLYDGLLPSRGLLKVMVGGKADTPSPSGKLPYNGSLQWVTSSRSIQIIDNQGTTTGRFENRYSYMTDLEFINMLSEYESEAVDVVNNGQMFGLFTNAFDSLLPILSIAIFPNISLGMLLFIPLIGAIIVIVIRVVKK